MLTLIEIYNKLFLFPDFSTVFEKIVGCHKFFSQKYRDNLYLLENSSYGNTF